MPSTEIVVFGNGFTFKTDGLDVTGGPQGLLTTTV
jgi:hypothetical protein